ncbi:MAG: MFS transporter [Sphingomonadales bacterium]|nr:MFS transporter [Sphingomonadales bacterium]
MSAQQGKGWRGTILAGLANYIDAGSIVAMGSTFALWKALYGLDDNLLGIIAAFSANGIGAGVGALVGGRLCDLFGRKKIYQYDMLFYAFGMLFLVFATAPWMIITGSLLVGLAVGADIPASWSLIAEQAPDKKRGAHSGVAQLLWYLGPVMVLVAFFAIDLMGWGIIGARVVFGHLAVLAIALTFLRSKMAESERWEEAKAQRIAEAGAPRQSDWAKLFQPQYLKSMVYLILMYGLWNLWAGTNGIFMPLLLETAGGLPRWVAALLPAAYFAIGIVSILFVFMALSDKMNQRSLFALAAAMQVVGMALPAIFGLSLEIAIIHIVIMGFAAGFGAQSFFQLWSAEMFPTAIRATAQGLTFAVVRIALGIWTFIVPALASADYQTLAWILTAFLAASGIIGTIWAPRNEGKSLEQLDAERQAKAA